MRSGVRVRAQVARAVPALCATAPPRYPDRKCKGDDAVLRRKCGPGSACNTAQSPRAADVGTGVPDPPWAVRDPQRRGPEQRPPSPKCATRATQGHRTPSNAIQRHPRPRNSARPLPGAAARVPRRARARRRRRWAAATATQRSVAARDAGRAAGVPVWGRAVLDLVTNSHRCIGVCVGGMGLPQCAAPFIHSLLATQTPAWQRRIGRGGEVPPPHPPERPAYALPLSP